MRKNFHTSNIPDYGEIHYNPRNSSTSHQLELFTLANKSQKPQISSIPGIPPREQHRYQVKLGNAVLGNFLTIDQALELAKQGGES